MQSFIRLIIVLSVLASVFVSYGYTETIDGITWTYSVESGEAILGNNSSGTLAISEKTSGAIVYPTPSRTSGVARSTVAAGLRA